MSASYPRLSRLNPVSFLCCRPCGWRSGGCGSRHWSRGALGACTALQLKATFVSLRRFGQAYICMLSKHQDQGFGMLRTSLVDLAHNHEDALAVASKVSVVKVVYCFEETTPDLALMSVNLRVNADITVKWSWQRDLSDALDQQQMLTTERECDRDRERQRVSEKVCVCVRVYGCICVFVCCMCVCVCARAPPGRGTA